MGGGRVKTTYVDDQDDDTIALSKFQGQTKTKKRNRVQEEEKDEDTNEESMEKQSAAPATANLDRKKRKSETPSETTPKVNAGKRQKVTEVKKTPENGEKQEEGKYQRLILFVGQIPFEATEQDLSKHFAEHGAGKVKVRLLTEKG